MSTSGKDRQRAYRERKKAAAYRRVCFDASPDTCKAIDAAKASGLTINALVEQALARDSMTDRQWARAEAMDKAHLLEQKEALAVEVARLEQRNDELARELTTLKNERRLTGADTLKAELARLEADAQDHQQALARYKAEGDGLRAEIARLKANEAGYREQISRLETRHAVTDRSDRDRRILELHQAGEGSREIARQLDMSESTVRYRLKKLEAKP